MAASLPFPQSFRTGLPETIGQVALVCAGDGDIAFLKRLYRTTREVELAATGWPEAMKTAFADNQFHLQHADYVRRHPNGEFLVVRAGQMPIGRLYVDASGETLHIIDIAFLPEWQGRGIGSAIVTGLQQRANASHKAVTLNVEIENRRAQAFYRRAGFSPDTAPSRSHIAMRWAN